MDKISIRLAKPPDAKLIAEFNSASALETENKELIPELITSGVEAVFENPTLGFYVVAEADGAVVACLMVTNEWSDWRNGMFWWIQSVYVHPDYRRRGIYRDMYEFVKTIAKEEPNVCGFRLYVEKENTKAQEAYSSMGMEKTGYRLFEELKKGVKCFKGKSS